MKISNFAVILILAGMFFTMVFSSMGDSATFDEVAHIGAGYTYITQKDGRLNPEHPPLIKNISTLPLLFLNLNFSVNQPFWTIKNVNDRQWLAGNTLLYESGNDADKILLLSRLPIMLLAIVFGWILFWWTRKNHGVFTAFLTLCLFVLSPTFLAHSRYVTTDLGATMAFFLSAIFFIRFLKNNDRKSLIYFGIVLGFSLLVKFSLVILLPFFVIVGVIYNKARLSFVFKFFRASLLAIAVIWLFYIPHVWNYPLEQNLTDARYTLGSYKTAKFAPEIAFTLLSNKLTQPLGQYLHGFLMATQRTAGGNSAYFLGEVSSKGWISYFPVLFLTKEQIGLYILILLSLVVAIKQRKKLNDKKTAIFLALIIYYWAWSLWSPLNVGVRHILPTLPFLFILVAKSIDSIAKIPKFVLLIFAISWMVIEMVFAFPFFLSYYNSFGGGVKNGYKIATDSNYDWGQDLKRLKIWIEENNVRKIYLDYFGGGSPKYYLGDKFEFWRYEKGPPPVQSEVEEPTYFAVSTNSFVGAENLYFWLKDKEPVARAGSSIFIFSF